MARNKRPNKPVAHKRANGTTIIKGDTVKFPTELPTNKSGGKSPILPVGEMHLAKIKNRYMFDSNNPTKEHVYAVYVDEQTKEVRAIQTTHLYIPDEENLNKVKRGLLRRVKFDDFDTPSGVNNYYYNTDKDGKPIDLNHADVQVNKKALPQSQAIDIKRFAKNKRKR